MSINLKRLLNEMLYAVYNIDKLVSILNKKHNPLKISFKKKNDYNFDMVVGDALKNKDLIPDIIKTITNTYNYVPSYIILINTTPISTKSEKYNLDYLNDLIKNNDFFIISFEAKYTNKVLRAPTKFYYTTEMIYKDKILKIGLVPKSKNKMFNYNDRIYLADSLSKIDELLKNKMFKKGNNPYSVFEIDSSFIDNINTKLYVDPKFENAYFVVNNIPPKYIKHIKDVP